MRPPSPKASRLYAPARTELEMWTWASRLEGRRRRSGASWGADSLAASSRACSGTLVFFISNGKSLAPKSTYEYNDVARAYAGL